MVLITSAKYLDSEFQAEFGKIPPAFLPLGNKRLYEYQIELFSSRNEKIALSLPKSFKIDETDKNKLYNLLGGGGQIDICPRQSKSWRIRSLLP
ncbi:hypothetical protein [Helicobacter turcicus]|uniref:hypothetical protein n=1 Tax=Helicobacter turcicus TaxID=2867412 RepID=UPI001F2F64C2|nr:hypothetical protein [Helicobacter turcicus]